MIKDGVILAAGQGIRLKVISGDKPKPLVAVHDKALIDRGIENLINFGVENIVVVVGYEHKRIEDHLAKSKYIDKITFILNEDWKKENGLSVLVAQAGVQGEWFFLQMVDHVFDPVIYDKAAEFLKVKGMSYLCVDKNIEEVFDIDDATKLTIATDGSISAIAKDLVSYDACDTGLFLMSKDIFPFFENAKAENRNTISNAVSDAGKQDKFFTIDVTGYKWIDVDTEEAWEEATRVFK